MVGDIDKPSTTIFSRKIQSSHVTLAMHGMVLFQHLSRFSIYYFQPCAGPMEQGDPYDSAGITYELIALKVCFLESSLFMIIFNRLKYSFWVLIWLFCWWSDFLQNLSICIVGLLPVTLALHHYWVGCFLFEQVFHVWLVIFLHLSIPNLTAIWSLNLLTTFIIDASWLSFVTKSLKPSMNKRCEIMSPWRLILYPMLLVFSSQESRSNVRMNSNPDGLLGRSQYWLKNDWF